MAPHAAAARHSGLAASSRRRPRRHRERSIASSSRSPSTSASRGTRNRCPLHAVGSRSVLNSTYFADPNGCTRRIQVGHREAQPGNHHRPRLDTAVAIDPLFEFVRLDEVLEVIGRRPGTSPSTLTLHGFVRKLGHWLWGRPCPSRLVEVGCSSPHILFRVSSTLSSAPPIGTAAAAWRPRRCCRPAAGGSQHRPEKETLPPE